MLHTVGESSTPQLSDSKSMVQTAQQRTLHAIRQLVLLNKKKKKTSWKKQSGKVR